MTGVRPPRRSRPPRRRRSRASGRRPASSTGAAARVGAGGVASVVIARVPLAADEEVRQRVAGDVLDVLAAGPDDRAVGHDDLERQDRLARLAVLDAAQAAGVGAQVATDRAHLVARGVRRVEQALGGDGGLEMGVDDARLDDRDEVLAVDLEDLVHRGEDHRQAALDAGGATRQARPGAAGDDRDPEFGSDPDEVRDFRRGGREDDGPREPGPEIGRLVVAVPLAVDRVGEQPDPREAGGDGGHERIGRHGRSLPGDRRLDRGAGVAWARCDDPRASWWPCSWRSGRRRSPPRSTGRSAPRRWPGRIKRLGRARPRRPLRPRRQPPSPSSRARSGGRVRSSMRPMTPTCGSRGAPARSMSIRRRRSRTPRRARSTASN